MSEYQYYEFQAVDRSLTNKQISELRALSTRATITGNRFVNTYHFGSFRGNPRKMMASYFDAHVYVSNFGSLNFMLRLPRGVLSEETLASYATDDTLEWWSTDEYTILVWRREDEEPDYEVEEGEGWMGQLLPIRDELIRGDYRSLYIGWLSSLAGVSTIEGDGPREPPVPAGLGSLTGSQTALASFLGVNKDLLSAAAVASPAISEKRDSEEQITEWVAQLSQPEMQSLIARIIVGEGIGVQTELQSRYYRSGNEPTENSQAHRRTATALVAMATQKERERTQREFRERERKRHAHLEGLVPRFSELWATVIALAEEQKASSYEKACTLLVDMRDAYAHVGRQPEFDTEFARFLAPNSRRTGLVRRLKEVLLL